MRRLALVGLAALLLAGCAEERAPRASPSGTSAAGLLPADRLALPQYDVDQFQALLGELRGTPVVVNVWGSWCPPCREEAPVLGAAAKEYAGRAQFLGIDILDDRPSARAFILEYDWTYPSIFDPQGAIRDGLGYIGQPITLIYDSQGDLAFEWQGTITEDILRREIHQVL
jgi:thiol-disulfide isomerase/thioredoxin